MKSNILNNIINRYRKLNRCLRSRNLVKRIAKKNSDYTIAIMYGTGIGDLCLSIAYLQEFKAHYQRKICLVASSTLKELVFCYGGYDKLVFISKQQTNDMIFMLLKHFRWRWFERKFNNYEIIYTNPWYYQEMSSSQNCFVLDILKKNVYRIDSDICQIPRIPLSEGDCKTENYKKILINGFSNSTVIDIQIFDKLILYFKKLGYVVYSNCINESSFCFNNTERLVSDIFNLYSIANKFDYILSVRSGIIDFLASAKTKFILLYEHNNYLPLYSIKQWPNVDAIELYYDDENLMRKISEYVEE